MKKETDHGLTFKSNLRAKVSVIKEGLFEPLDAGSVGEKLHI